MADATSGTGVQLVADAAGRSQQGATFGTRYYGRALEGVPVTIDELEDFKSSSLEEFGQFAIGQFFMAGSFWLGIERLVTIGVFWADTLFWVCVVAFIGGSVVAYFGLRQLRRRRASIDRIIKSVKLRIESGST
jgi:hypothetical protein